MPKKNNYSGNKQNDRSSSSWIPTSILDSNDLHSSSMTQSKLDEIKSLFSFKVNAVVPAPNHTVDWFLHGWVCFYSYPFDMDFHLLDDDENDIVEGFVEFLAKPGSDLKQHFKGAKGEIVATVTWMGAA
ncbi:hypothetical protein POM88_000154 [Heracleum sosnowskyi]|uniref:Uncharacterized protein n=1 Tax=Heracleum sosnowskyi TaxID=360622 RepID=A0AAD8N8F9_9APIA|nr:hypothetical protein POM88_000154 [Heracleum sosnowskyi]